MDAGDVLPGKKRWITALAAERRHKRGRFRVHLPRSSNRRTTAASSVG